MRNRFRKLHRPEGIFLYRIYSHQIEIRSPSKHKHVVNMSDFTGWSWDTLERAAWKGYWPEIGPSDVDRYIDRLPGAFTR